MITTEGVDEYMEILRMAFERLTRNKLELRLDKYKFLQFEIIHLGYRASGFDRMGRI